MKKIFLLFFVLGSIFYLSDRAKAVSAGNLVKQANSASVYYVGTDNKRYVFPSQAVFNSWYPNGAFITTISATELSAMELGGNITMRAGAKLIQIVTNDTPWKVADAKVYAVSSNGTKHHITSSVVATTLFGARWESLISPITESIASNYKSGYDLDGTKYPEGTLVKRGNDIYYIKSDGTGRKITVGGLSANRLSSNNAVSGTLNIINTNSDITTEVADIVEVVRNKKIPASLVSVITPNGGEIFEIGKPHIISWKTSAVLNSNQVFVSGVALYKGSKYIAETVNVKNVSLTDSVAWTIPDKICGGSCINLEPGNDYKIKVVLSEKTSEAKEVVSDVSDAFFSITKIIIPPPVTFIHAQSNKIIGEDGNEIVLRGFNDNPFTYLASKETYSDVSQNKIDRYNKAYAEYYTADSDLGEMKAMGANVARVSINFDRLELEPYKYEESILQTIQDFVDRSYKHGIYVILTLSNFAESRATTATYDTDYLKLWSDVEFKKRVVAAWARIAERLANNPGVAGYDLINEPEPPSGAELRSFYLDTITAIRKTDKNHMIILERCHFNTSCSQVEFGGKYDDSNIMLSLHYYNDDSGDMTLSSVKYDTKQKIEELVKGLYAVPETQGRPLYLGEFSSLWVFGEPGLQWTKDMIEVMNKYGMHWTYFARKDNVPGDKKNGVPLDRGLYRAREWWHNIDKSKIWLTKYVIEENETEQLRLLDEELRLLLTTENYEINSSIKSILETGL